MFNKPLNSITIIQQQHQKQEQERRGWIVTEPLSLHLNIWSWQFPWHANLMSQSEINTKVKPLCWRFKFPFHIHYRISSGLTLCRSRCYTLSTAWRKGIVTSNTAVWSYTLEPRRAGKKCEDDSMRERIKGVGSVANEGHSPRIYDPLKITIADIFLMYLTLSIT